MKLFVLISNGGDGSYYPRYTLNAELIAKLEAADDEGEMDCEALGCDGDGFHYDVIEVPDGSTPESLGIRVLDDNYADRFNED